MAKADPISLWETTAEEPEPAPGPDPQGHCDVAIVGGGFTGLSTALFCAEKGLSAHVLEAEQLGFGGSGRNVGLVNAGLWLPPDELRAALGPDHGPRFVDLFAEGPGTVFDLIETHQIRCEATRSGTIHAAHAPSGFEELRNRHAGWRRMGAPVDLLGPDEVAKLTGSRAFHGGLLDRRAGTINPVGYVRGLARAAKAAGAAISTAAKVTGVTPEQTGWRLATSRGDLAARNVVLATDAYTDTLWPGLDRVYSTIRYFQLATGPLGDAASAILQQRQGLWTTGSIMFSCRRDAAGRLIIGSMGRVIGNKDQGLSRAWARRKLKRLFPELGEVAFEDAWDGRIAMTPDHLPRIHRLADGLWTPIGYNGRGITTGTLFGQALADLLSGMDPARLPMPVSDMQAVPGARLRERAYDLAFTANQLWKSIA